MSVYVGNPLPETPHEQARRALAELRTPSGFVLGDVIARLVLDSGIVSPVVSDGEGATSEAGKPCGNAAEGLPVSECRKRPRGCECFPASPVVAPSATDEGPSHGEAWQTGSAPHGDRR